MTRYIASLGALILLAGCGGNPPPAPPDVSTSTTPTVVPEPGPEPTTSTGLTRLAPPLKLEGSAVQGSGEERKATVTVTNTGDQPLKAIVVHLYFLDAQGKVGNDVPHSQNGFSPRNQLDPGRSHEIPVNAFFMKDDTARIEGVVRGSTFTDESTWPPWTGEPPAREGDAPVSAKLLGVSGSGDMRFPVAGCWNHSDKPITSIHYTFNYLGEDGEVLDSTGYGHSGSSPLVQPGKSCSIAGGKAPPKGAVDARVIVRSVTYEDESTWKAPKP